MRQVAPVGYLTRDVVRECRRSRSSDTRRRRGRTRRSSRSSSRARSAALMPASLPPIATRRSAKAQARRSLVTPRRSALRSRQWMRLPPATPHSSRLARPARRPPRHLRAPCTPPSGYRLRDPDLVLESMAAGDAILNLGREPLCRQAPRRRHHLVRRTHLDTEVVQRPGLGGILEQHQLQRRVGDREVGIAGAPLGRLGLEQLRIEPDRLVEIADVQRQLHSPHLSSRSHSRRSRHSRSRNHSSW